MKKLYHSIIIILGYITSFFLPVYFVSKIKNLRNLFYTGWLKRYFAKFGNGSIIIKPICISQADRISIGSQTVISGNCTITCSANASICMGDQCTIGSYNHITACNEIIIGNGVLTGPQVLITDNSHGENSAVDMDKPAKRKIYSKGKVVIGNNVWIGEKASILPGTTIGDGAVVGANSVVTRDVPSYSIVVGSPARVVYTMINK